MNVYVADYLHLGDIVQQLSCHFEQRAGEVTRYAFVAASTFQVLQQHCLIEAFSTRGETADCHA